MREIESIMIRAAEPDFPRHDTASVAELPDGTLMIVWHHFRRGPRAGNDEGLARIFGKYSHDGGRTWDEERLLLDIEPGDVHVTAPALSLLPDGTLLLLALRSHRMDSSSMEVYESGDNGRNFRLRSRVWSHSKGIRLQGGASQLLLTAAGRLLIPCHGGDGLQGSQHNTAGCFYSDDGGYSWRESNSIDLPKRGAMEASVAELEDGELVMSLRTQLGTVFLARSTDGGAAWSPAQSTGLQAPESCTCLRRLPGTDDLVLFWNDSVFDPAHHHFGERVPLSAARSSDRGRTWRKCGDIETAPGEYSNLGCTFLHDGRALLTYWSIFPPFDRTAVNLKAALIERSWFDRNADPK